MKFKEGLLGLSMLALVGCSGEPSTSTITGCIADANGFAEVGGTMKQGMQTFKLMDVYVNNLFEESGNNYLAHVTVDIGVQMFGLKGDTLEQMAKLQGLEAEDGFIVEQVEAQYRFMEGSRGWGCAEL